MQALSRRDIENELRILRDDAAFARQECIFFPFEEEYRSFPQERKKQAPVRRKKRQQEQLKRAA